MLTQVFQYQDQPITFSLGGEVLVNATTMGKAFGKQPSSFLRNAQTEAFIAALQNRIPETEIVQTINGGSNFGTWMHQKLALKFAAWLSPEFELWVYDRIEELLTTGKTELKPLSKEETIMQAMRFLQADVESLQEQNRLLGNTIEAQAPAVLYVNNVLASKNNYTTTTIAKELGLSANALNKRLNELKVQFWQDEHWVLYAKYQNKGYTQTRTHTHYDSENKPFTTLQTRWTETGRQFIHSLLNPHSAVA